MTPLSILYDVSLLGFCKDDPAKITGMPRAILEQVARLRAAPELDMAFCASEDGADAQAFVRRHAAFAGAPFAATLHAGGLDRARVFHTPHSAVPDEVRRHGRLTIVQTIWDMIPFLLPETLTVEYQEYYADILHRLRPGDHVITISESAKADFCGYTGFPGECVHVVPLAANVKTFYPCADPARLAAARARYAIPPDAPYLLSVCTFEPRKNLRHVIRCFVQAASAVPDLRLVLAGGRGWMFAPILAELAGADAALRARIITTGYVDDADLAPLYSGAAGFLYLSRYEGFGLPPLEAMQCGAPVVVSDTSSLPEVVGDAGILLDPDDVDGLCQAMLDLHTRPALRARLAAASLERARRFSWEQNAWQTLEVYRRAAEEKG